MGFLLKRNVSSFHKFCIQCFSVCIPIYVWLSTLKTNSTTQVISRMDLIYDIKHSDVQQGSICDIIIFSFDMNINMIYDIGVFLGQAMTVIGWSYYEHLMGINILEGLEINI